MALQKTIWRFLKIFERELLYDPAIPFWGIHPKKTKTGFQRDKCTTTFIVALFTTAKT